LRTRKNEKKTPTVPYCSKWSVEDVDEDEVVEVEPVEVPQ
jgi:hypothetical protein